MFATLRAVRRWCAVSDRPTVGHERVWGPVSAAEAAKAGSARPAVSVVIKPRIEPCFAQAAMQCIPAEVLPRACDTKEELVARLGASVFLDDAHVLNGGNGKRGATGKRRRLNATDYPAPRRKSWSVLVEGDGEVADDGETVLQLYNYSAYGRLAADVRCAPMPLPVFHLAEQVWLAAMPYLCEESRSHPPTHCQLLLYYVMLKSCMGRHRDNYTVHHLRSQLSGQEYAGSPAHAGMENSQRMGSEVLLYTEGNTSMDFVLSFPPFQSLDADIHDYVRRKVFTAPLGAGTLMIFKGLDDEFFCHEAFFNALQLQQSVTGFLACFAFRWCTSIKRFRKAPSCSFHSPVPAPPQLSSVDVLE